MKINFKKFFRVFILLLFFILSNLISFVIGNMFWLKHNINVTGTRVEEEIGEKIGKEIGEAIVTDLEQFFKTAESSIILATPKSNNIVYIVPGDEWDFNEENLYSEEYKCTLDDIEARIKEIKDKGKSSYLFSVLLFPMPDINYGYLFKVVDRYEETVYTLSPSKDKKIWYRFAGYSEPPQNP